MKVPNIGRAMAKPKPPDDGVDLRINDESTPIRESVRTVNDDEVCSPYYARSPQAHSHHLQDAKDDIDMAVWSWNEQGRQLHQEDKNGDDIIGRGKSNGRS
jgi:hypothetical protein